MPVSAPPKPELIENLQNQMLVQIVIEGANINVYPMRASDAVVYKRVAKPGKGPAPAKPEQVRWIVKGLKQNQVLRIETKQGPEEKDHFPAHTYEIPYGFNSILSGEPMKPAGQGKELSWNYSITLLENGVTLAALDPTIIIKDDP